VKLLGDEVDLHASWVGLSKSIKKFDVLSIVEEMKILAQEIC
jgi:hypothetical protein